MMSAKPHPPREARGILSRGAATELASAAVRDSLGRHPDSEACAALAARMAGVMGEAFESARTRQAGVACQAGCSFCCHLRVMVYPHEAVALLHHLQSRMPQSTAEGVRQRLTAHAAQLKAQDPTQPRPPIPCAFLEEGRCSAYEVRPISCAGYHSLDRARCQQRYETSSRVSVGIPVSDALLTMGIALQDELGRSVQAAGLSARRVELQTTLAGLIARPDLVMKWRAGGQWAADDRGLLEE